MSMRRVFFPLAVLGLATGACPGPLPLTGNGGLFIGGGGGGGTGRDALFFLVQPNDAKAGNIITPAIQIEVLDTLARPDSAYANAITASLAVNPGGGSLSGTLSVVPVNGIASFGDLVVDKAGTGYILRVSGSGALTKTSTPFTISP